MNKTKMVPFNKKIYFRTQSMRIRLHISRVPEFTDWARRHILCRFLSLRTNINLLITKVYQVMIALTENLMKIVKSQVEIPMIMSVKVTKL